MTEQRVVGWMSSRTLRPATCGLDGAYYDDDAGGSSGSAYLFGSLRPVLTIPTAIPGPAGTPVDVPVELTTNANDLASLAFSVDYDPTCLSCDANDTDGELDVVLADFTTTRVFSEGLLVEVDLRLHEAGTATIEGGVIFAVEPPASFGDVQGRSVPGTAGIGPAPQALFADGFETGDTSAWSGEYP